MLKSPSQLLHSSAVLLLLLHLLKDHGDELRSSQCVMLTAAGYSISPDMVFILESFTEYLKLLWQEHNLTRLSSLQALLCVHKTGLT